MQIFDEILFFQCDSDQFMLLYLHFKQPIEPSKKLIALIEAMAFRFRFCVFISASFENLLLFKTKTFKYKNSFSTRWKQATQSNHEKAQSKWHAKLVLTKIKCYWMSIEIFWSLQCVCSIYMNHIFTLLSMNAFVFQAIRRKSANFELNSIKNTSKT